MVPAPDDFPLIPRDVLRGNPERTSVCVSPDGARLSFVAPLEGVLNVWVAPVDDLDAAEPITRDTHRGVRLYFWAFTSRHVLYVQDRNGDENWRLYAHDLETGETRDLTPLEGVQARIIGLSHRRPEELIVGLNDRDARYHDVYRVDLLTGERQLLFENNEFADFDTDDDLRVRLAERQTPDGGGEVFLAGDDGEWNPLLTIGQEDALTTSPSGFDKTGGVLFLRDSRGRDTAAFTALDLASGEQTVLAEDPRADADGTLRHPTERNVQAVSFEYDRTRWVFLDEAVRADFAALERLGDGEIHVASRTLDDSTWIVALAPDDGPVAYYLYDRSTREARFLFHTQPELAALPLAKLQPRVVRSRDGLDLMCYLSLPPWTDLEGKGRPPAPLPMVLYVHGGPWGRDSWGFVPTHQWLANRGYAVLSVNYRGSTGFGKAFVNAGDHEWARKMHDDLIDAVDWAVAEGIADADKVAVMGGSYGGYATLVGLTFTPERFACGVDVVGPSNLVTLLESIPPYWEPLLALFTSRVGDPKTDEGRKLLESRSPLSFVDRIERPLLIGQGANDPRVKQAESDQIVKSMREKGIPVSYVLFEDEGHGFVRPENRLLFDAVTEAFLAEHLGGRCEPMTGELRDASLTVRIGGA